MKTQIDARTLVIPDLWHLAMALNADKRYMPGAYQAVLETWYLAHDLKNALAEAQEAK